MYSKRHLIRTEVFLNVFSIIGGSAILCDSRANKFYTTPYSRQTTRCNMVVLIIQIIFGALRLAQFWNLRNKTDHELFRFNVSYIILLAMIIPLTCQLILTTNCHESTDCFNQLINYVFRVRKMWVSLSDKEIASSYPTGSFLDHLFAFVAMMLGGFSFFGSVAIYLLEILPFQWMSLIPTKFRTQALFCMHLGFYGYLLIICFVSVGIGLMIVATYVGELS